MEHLSMRFVVCTHNEGCDDLEPWKIYQVLPDETAVSKGHVRVVDDSGEDYLYPAEFFLPIDLPQAVEEALRLAS